MNPHGRVESNKGLFIRAAYMSSIAGECAIVADLPLNAPFDVEVTVVLE